VFVQLLSMSNQEVREQAVWALGNIAGDSPRCRDLVLSYQLIPQLVLQLGDGNGHWTNLTMLRNATWTLSNLCRGKPPPRWELIAPSLPMLIELVVQEDEEVFIDACWALSYISEPSEQIQAVIDAGALPCLVAKLAIGSAQVQTPALRAVGNVATGTAEQTRAVLECDVLPAALALLHSPKKEIRKEACWMVSNLTAGSSDQVEAVCRAGLMPRLVEMCTTEEFEIRKEATYAVCNAFLGGTPALIGSMLELRMMPAILEMLQGPDPQLIITVLETVETILVTGASSASEELSNRCAQMIDDEGGVERIEDLLNHSNKEIYTKAAHLLENYLSSVDEEDALIAPVVRETGFTFAVPSTNANMS